MSYLIFCEEAGDKGLVLKKGTSRYYVVSAVIVHDMIVQNLRNQINTGRKTILRHRKPLEWKTLDSKTKNDDAKLSKFMDFLAQSTPSDFFISQVIADKSSITGLKDPKRFMNYLYGLIFKRINPMLNKLNATADLFIDRNTDTHVEHSLSEYLHLIPRITNTSFPQRQGYSVPTFMEPKADPALQLADFVSGLTLRIFEDYKDKLLSAPTCHNCKTPHCALSCNNIALEYPNSWSRVVKWNNCTISQNSLVVWSWKGLLWHPYGTNPVSMIVTK